MPISIGLLLIALLIQTPARVATPQQLWQVEFKEEIRKAAIARNATCLLVATDSQAIVLDGHGRQLWFAPIAADPQLVAVGAMAVSPKCDWVAISSSGVGRATAASYQLQLIRKDGFQTGIAINEIGINPYIRLMDISPNGELLAIGFADSALWLATRDGNVRWRLQSQGVEIEPEFSTDGQRLLLKGFFGTGLMDLKGEWIWKSGLRNLVANRDYSLFAGLSGVMHFTQNNEVILLDAKGNTLWRSAAWDAAMAIAPDGSFVAFGGHTEKTVQPKVPPFPIVPELNDTPEIWLRDRTGKVLAHRQFDGYVFGVSSDSTCTLVSELQLRSAVTASDFVGLNRQLAVSWRHSPKTYEPLLVASNVLIEIRNFTVLAYRIPNCK